MQPKQHALVSLFQTVTCSVLALVGGAQGQAQDKKVDPTGTWTWSVPGRNGGQARQSTLKLKLEGEKVTGTLTAPGRQGAQARDTTIEEAKLKGDELSFKVTRESNGNKIIAKYTGKISGGAIKGKIETERNGQTQSRDWEAKREADKK